MAHIEIDGREEIERDSEGDIQLSYRDTPEHELTDLYLFANGRVLLQSEVKFKSRSRVDFKDELYFHQDILGSTIFTSNEKGSHEREVEYDAYGQLLSNRVESREFLYNGKQFNDQTKLYNYGFRDYNASTARFTTLDPIRDGDNWFVYVNGEPVGRVDLWGLDERIYLSAVGGTWAHGQILPTVRNMVQSSKRYAVVYSETTFSRIGAAEGAYLPSNNSLKHMDLLAVLLTESQPIEFEGADLKQEGSSQYQYDRTMRKYYNELKLILDFEGEQVLEFIPKEVLPPDGTRIQSDDPAVYFLLYSQDGRIDYEAWLKTDDTDKKEDAVLYEEMVSEEHMNRFTTGSKRVIRAHNQEIRNIIFPGDPKVEALVDAAAFGYHAQSLVNVWQFGSDVMGPPAGGVSATTGLGGKPTEIYSGNY
jgi:RHS repeat-associated protein